MDSSTVPTPVPVSPRPRTGLAVTSLVLGLMGNLCLWILAGIPAIITGHIAYSRAKRFPERYGGAGIAIAGFVLGYVSLIVGAATLAFIAAITLPAMAKAKGKAIEIQCVNNLKQLSIAAKIYAIDHQGQFPTNFPSMGTALASPGILVCPGDPNVSPLEGSDWSALGPGNISYEFLLPGATEADHLQDTIFRCPIHGHRALGDGSVQQGQQR